MDIFGIKRRRDAKEARVQGYVEAYRRMSEGERKQYAAELRHIVRTGFFRNNMVVEELQAAARVCREEAE